MNFKGYFEGFGGIFLCSDILRFNTTIILFQTPPSYQFFTDDHRCTSTKTSSPLRWKLKTKKICKRKFSAIASHRSHRYFRCSIILALYYGNLYHFKNPQHPRHLSTNSVIMANRLLSLQPEIHAFLFIRINSIDVHKDAQIK